MASPNEDELAEVVRRGLGLGPGVELELREVVENTNFNHVFRVHVGGESLYLKVVPEKPKRFAVPIPRERIFVEVEALGIFRRLGPRDVLVPEVRFVDRGHFAFGMSDVGGGRRVLLDIIAREYRLLQEVAGPLGSFLAAVHAGSRGCPEIRPARQDQIVRQVIFDGLLGPGAQALFSESWPEVMTSMRERRECLIHADLWGKNILVQAGCPPALVDFEGVLCGDPAFDLGTLLAVAALPVLEEATLLAAGSAFTRDLLGHYHEAQEDRDWAMGAIRRSLRYAGTFLAVRGFGPFAYPMSDPARNRLAVLARDLTRHAPAEVEDYLRRLQQALATTPI